MIRYGNNVFVTLENCFPVLQEEEEWYLHILSRCEGI